MKILIVFAHPEPKSFNTVMFKTAIQALEAAGHEVKTSDLYAMEFDPVSSRKNFTSVQNPDYLKLQREEMYATEVKGFVPYLLKE